MRRRQFLGGAAAAGGAALAGCSAVPLGGANGFDFRNWMHAPGERGGDGPTVFNVAFDRPATVHERAAHLPAEYVEQFETYPNVSPLTGIDYAAVEYGLRYAGVEVFHGGPDAGEIRDRLGANGFETVREHGEYTVHFVRDESADTYGWGFAVAGDTLLARQYYVGPETAADVLELVIDTGTGDAERLTGTVEAADALFSSLSPGQELFAEVLTTTAREQDDERPVEGYAGRGATLETTGEETRVDAAYVFETAGAAEQAGVRKLIDDTPISYYVGVPGSEWSVERDGTVVSAATTVSSDQVGTD